MQMSRHIVQAAKVNQCGIEIEELDRPPARFAFRFDAGAAQHQRSARGILEHSLLHPLTVFAEAVSVIAQERDGRVFLLPRPFQRCEQPADLRVEEQDGRVVSAHSFQPLLFCHAPIRRRGEVRPSRRDLHFPLLERDRFDPVQRDHVEVLCRCDRRAVRLVETGSEKPRLASVRFH
jgi:hypothetical protein